MLNPKGLIVILPVSTLMFPAAPISGVGIALYGGLILLAASPAILASALRSVRFPTLYTSSSYELAISEAHQGLPFKLQPLTIVSYTADHDSVLDLSSASACAAAGVAFEDIQCAWELIAFDGGTPPGWTLSDRLIHNGVGGIIVPSFAQGTDGRSVNIVFWDWQASSPRQVAVVDDEDRLPKDDASWR